MTQNHMMLSHVKKSLFLPFISLLQTHFKKLLTKFSQNNFSLR